MNSVALFYQAIANCKESITWFLIPGHTKNRCDSAFILMKYKMETRHLNIPGDLMIAMNGPLVSSTVVSAQVLQ